MCQARPLTDTPGHCERANAPHSASVLVCLSVTGWLGQSSFPLSSHPQSTGPDPLILLGCSISGGEGKRHLPGVGPLGAGMEARDSPFGHLWT